MTTLTIEDNVRHVVQLATLAPSVHNSQPWTFVMRPDGLELRADPSRQLQVLDPDGRQLHLSCGAALLHVRVAARALGLLAQVRLLPSPDDPTLLAHINLSPGRAPRFEDVHLATAILHRRTYRGPLAPGSVPAPLINRLREVAEAEGAVLRPVTRTDEVVELAVLVDHATRDEERDPAYRDELQAWLRTDPTSTDGLPVDLVSDAAKGSAVRQRDFTMSHPAAMDGSHPVAELPLLLVLGTPQDDPESWLRAGQALAAVLLTAAGGHVQAQPIGQVTDTTGYRRRLQHTLGMLTMPQLVLRMGRPVRATAPSPRRALEDVLV